MYSFVFLFTKLLLFRLEREQQYAARRLKDFQDALDREAVSLLFDAVLSLY